MAHPDDQTPSWRPQDEDHRNRRNMSEGGDRDWDSQWEDRDERSMRQSTERYGQGQSGYGAGRYEGDRSYGSRNQANMSHWDQSRERGGDERFSGGRGGEPWSPDDRDNRGMTGSRGTYGHPGHWDEDRGGGYLGQSGQQMGYGNYGQQSPAQGGRGVQNQGGMYGQGGYDEGMHGRGGQQHRYGSQGYQGWGQSGQQRYGGGQGRSVDEPQNGGGGFERRSRSVSGSGYGHQPEHDVSFGGGYGAGGVAGQQGWRNQMEHDRERGYGPQGHHNYGNYQQDWGNHMGHGHTLSQHHRGQGPHRGKGPSGYTRSDERIREMVCDALTDHDEVDASNIDVAVKNGEVTLSGTVEDRLMKRCAEDCVENLSGVREVINNLRVGVRDSMERTGTGSSASGNTGARAGASQSASAVDTSGREQAQQGNNGSATSNGKDDKRHRA